MDEKKLTQPIFCAREQKTTEHLGSRDDNGEYVFTCTSVIGKNDKDEDVVCGRFIKFPADTTPELFAALVDLHEIHNLGQIRQSELQKGLDTLLGVTLQGETLPEATDQEQVEETQ